MRDGLLSSVTSQCRREGYGEVEMESCLKEGWEVGMGNWGGNQIGEDTVYSGMDLKALVEVRCAGTFAVR